MSKEHNFNKDGICTACGSTTVFKPCKAMKPNPINQPSELGEKHTCRYCGETKPVALFTNRYRKRTLEKYPGYICRECTAKRKRARYLAHKDELRVWHRENWKKTRKIKAPLMRLRYPDRIKARATLRNAVAAGKITKEDCNKCGDPNSNFHHTNGYSKENYFVGIWVCRPCHAQLHREIKEKSLI